MHETNEHLRAKSNQLTRIIDDLFSTLEETACLLKDWKPSYHTPFIEHMWTFKALEAELYAMGYEEAFVLTVKQIVYHAVFGN